LRVAEAVGLAFLFEARKGRPARKEIRIRPLQLLQGLLQRLRRRCTQPPGTRQDFPLGESLAQPRITQLLLAPLVPLFLRCQRLVEHEPASAGEAAHVTLLNTVWLQCELEGLKASHASIIVWSMKTNNDMRQGRHCVFPMLVHSVFVAKYRRRVFDKVTIARLHELFAKIGSDFDAELIEMDGERDHVHLLMLYPPKVAISKLVNSVKGASSRVLRNERPDLAQRTYHKGVLWPPSYFAASCGGAPIRIIRRYIEQQQTPD
jgi:putative transposase